MDGVDLTGFDKADKLRGLHEDVACRNLIAYYYIHVNGDMDPPRMTKLEIAQWMWRNRVALSLTPKERSRVQAVLARI